MLRVLIKLALHGVSLAGAGLSVGEDGTVEAVEDSLHEVAERFVVEVALFRPVVECFKLEVVKVLLYVQVTLLIQCNI